MSSDEEIPVHIGETSTQGELAEAPVEAPVEPPVEQTTDKSTEPPTDPPPPVLEAPTPASADWTVAELVKKKREEKGPFFACAFACCCCFLCYERMEFVLDFVCCKTCK